MYTAPFQIVYSHLKSTHFLSTFFFFNLYYKIFSKGKNQHQLRSAQMQYMNSPRNLNF